eukprot:scaffold22546_cov28-Tisochrysis_lutea.AAC.1
MVAANGRIAFKGWFWVVAKVALHVWVGAAVGTKECPVYARRLDSSKRVQDFWRPLRGWGGIVASGRPLPI